MEEAVVREERSSGEGADDVVEVEASLFGITAGSRLQFAVLCTEITILGFGLFTRRY